MPDSEEEDDDNLINLSGRRQRPRVLANDGAAVQRTAVDLISVSRPYKVASSLLDAEPSELLENARQHDAQQAGLDSGQGIAKLASPGSSGAQANDGSNVALVKTFFALPETVVQKTIDCLEQRTNRVVDEIIARCEEGLDDKDLEQQRDDIEDRLAAMRKLSGKRDEYQRLCSEKQHLHNALQHAVRARQGKEAALAANRAGKEALERFEVKCCELFRSFQSDFEHMVKSMEQTEDVGCRKTVAVRSTQGPTFAELAREPAVPSSSRIVQTQVGLGGGHQQIDTGPVRPNARASNVDLKNVETYFSPRTTRPVALSAAICAPKTHHSSFLTKDDFDDEFDDADEAIFAASNEMFSNRMGTPPAPYGANDDDDYGMGDDDDMLDFAEDIENRGLPSQQTYGSSDRQVFTETSGNVQNRQIGASNKKPKKTPAKDVESEHEKFRFPWSDDVKNVMRGRFRLKGFRKNQIEAINATLAGKDVFVLMPTGGGKSLCYQLPSLVDSGRTHGVTMVVSPLLSLMEDQVQHLRNMSIQAFMINGGTSREERDAINQGLKERDVEKFVQILYVTPEMLSQNASMIRTMESLYNRQKLARLVIDEAHCVSQWGHDFRPDYKLLGDIRRKFPRVPVMALTATATENVKVDTVHNLGIDGCEVLSSSFNRENLFYEVRAKAKGKEDIGNIAELIKENHPRQTGIVYCLSRKNCEDVAKALKSEHNLRAHHYHAGMPVDEKSKVQKQWQLGKYEIIVATIAFGMGIDKANVRFVIHYSIPKSLEGYYQETGRAGRDGIRSHCYLFYGYQDASRMKRMIDDDENSNWEQKERQRQMLRKMVQFCENKSDCRRVQVLGYFNESFDQNDCQMQCDNCNSNATFEEVDFTDYAQQAVSLVRQAIDSTRDNQNVTVLQCIDIFRGAGAKKLREGHGNLEGWGAGSSLDRGDVERLFYRLLSEDALREHNVPNRSGFATQYVGLGSKSTDFESGRRRIKMQIRSTPRPKSKAPAKKPKKVAANEPKQQKRANGRANGPPELPLSTNVSSPIQAASTRKRTLKAAQKDIAAYGYQHDKFVVPNPEDDGDYADEDDDEYSDDAFEPVRVAGQSRPEKTRTLGAPITSDSTMDNLEPTHRMYVDNFIVEAQSKVKDIMIDKSLRIAPFTDTMLRSMAIQFADTREKMLQIPGIDEEKLRLYGKDFLKMVNKTRQWYEETVRVQAEERPDPNGKNVIDLVSDEEDNEDEDDYGSIDIEDDEEDEGEPSAYFQQPKRVQAFNARFSQSQSAAMRTAPIRTAPAQSSQGQSKRRWKGKKRFVAKKSAGRDSRASNSARSRQTSDSVGDSARVTKRRAPAKRSTSGGMQARLSAARGGGGIAMMPT
jgi:bloom syndrome protein